MEEGTGILPGLPAVAGKPVHVSFDGGRLTSDDGILLLAAVEQRLKIGERLAACIEDRRDPDRVVHQLANMIRYRALLIAAGYPDGNDCDALKSDPAFKMAVGRLPESGDDLCSQPTISRLENLPGATALKRMMAAMVDLFCDSFAAGTAAHSCSTSTTPRTGCTAASNCRCGMRTTTAAAFCRSTSTRPPPASPSRSSCAPARPRTGPRWRWCCAMSPVASGRAGRRSRSSCAATAITAGPKRAPGASATARRLHLRPSRQPGAAAPCRRARRGRRSRPPRWRRRKVRRYGDFRYAAKSWTVERRVIARVEAGPQGADSRLIVTNLPGLPKSLYEKLYCGRGQAENLIKARKRPRPCENT